jgi:hypothetical protein
VTKDVVCLSAVARVAWGPGDCVCHELAAARESRADLSHVVSNTTIVSCKADAGMGSDAG